MSECPKCRSVLYDEEDGCIVCAFSELAKENQAVISAKTQRQAQLAELGREAIGLLDSARRHSGTVGETTIMVCLPVAWLNLALDLLARHAALISHDTQPSETQPAQSLTSETLIAQSPEVATTAIASVTSERKED